MSKGMLGLLPLSDTRGPRNDLEEKLAGPDGAAWLTALTRFLRKENPWEEPAPPPTIPMWRLVDPDTLEVNLDVQPNVPYEGITVHWTASDLIGRVRLKKVGMGRAMKLYRDGKEIVLRVDPLQTGMNGIKGTDLWLRVKSLSGLLHPNEQDALKANPDFLPESWKIAGRIYSWGAVFRSGNSRYVRCFFWSEESWRMDSDRLVGQFRELAPGARTVS